jgi:alpha-amylase
VFFFYYNILGFIAINNDDYDMDVILQTGLPSGFYCDVYNGNKVNNTCTGMVVRVKDDGTARIKISKESEDPVVAIHIESKIKTVLLRN